MNKVKEIISLTLITSIASAFGYVNFEPEIVGAATANDPVVVTQAVTSEISISSPADVTMSPDIAGTTGGTGNGSATWTVITNDTTGFILALKAGATPALASGADTFAEYTEAGAVPDYTWSVASAASEFGYTVEAATTADLAAGFKDNGSDTCGGAGSLDTADVCWDGFTTSDATVINRSSETGGAGEAEVVKFRAQSGASHFQEEGSYTATITATATTN